MKTSLSHSAPSSFVLHVLANSITAPRTVRRILCFLLRSFYLSITVFGCLLKAVFSIYQASVNEMAKNLSLVFSCVKTHLPLLYPEAKLQIERSFLSASAFISLNFLLFLHPFLLPGFICLKGVFVFSFTTEFIYAQLDDTCGLFWDRNLTFLNFRSIGCQYLGFL